MLLLLLYQTVALLDAEVEGEGDDRHVPAAEGEAAEAIAAGDVAQRELLLDLAAEGEGLAAALDAASDVGELVLRSEIVRWGGFQYPELDSVFGVSAPIS